jgi:hypothetical protein
MDYIFRCISRVNNLEETLNERDNSERFRAVKNRRELIQIDVIVALAISRTNHLAQLFTCKKVPILTGVGTLEQNQRIT